MVEFGRARSRHINVIALKNITKGDFDPLSATATDWLSRRRALEIGGKKHGFRCLRR